MVTANKTRNFQVGSDGREAGTKTFTFKARGHNGKTLAYNVRCNAARQGDACKVARKLFQDAQTSMSRIPDDNDKVRKIKRRPK